MMDFTWYILGALTGAAVIYLWKFSKRYHLNGLAWGGLIAGIFLILFSLAWSVGAVLEGVPRAASMGLLLFGLSGIVLLIFAFKYIDVKLEKISVSGISSPIAHETMQPVLKTPTADRSNQASIKRSALGEFLGANLKYVAYASLIAAFIFGLSTTKKDYESMIRKKIPDQKLTRVNDNPIVFELGEKNNDIGNYIVISEGQGYGGPFVIGVRIMDDAKVHEVMLLDNRETPAFRKKVEEADFPAQFKGKDVSDDFLTGEDIDIVSGATISTMAGTEAIRKAAHTAATQYFNLEPTWKKDPWKAGIGELSILILFILAFFPTVYQKKPWQYIYMGATIGIVGFYLNAAISVGSLAGLSMGFIPSIKTHLIWWILVVGTIAVLFLTGKNIYCFRICPFYGIQYIVGKIGGGKFKPSANILKRSKLVANVILWLSLMTIFLSSQPALGSFEPFAMMFSLNGVGIQWFLLPLALIGSLFMSSFWCRFFCPCGRTLTTLRQFRKKLITIIRERQVKEK
jgi:Na+-translocating ferredoxin:NAD+ oxidoreductase RnfG subunit